MYIISQLGFIFKKIYIRIFLFLKKSENLLYLNNIFSYTKRKYRKFETNFHFVNFFLKNQILSLIFFTMYFLFDINNIFLY